MVFCTFIDVIIRGSGLAVLLLMGVFELDFVPYCLSVEALIGVLLVGRVTGQRRPRLSSVLERSSD